MSSARTGARIAESLPLSEAAGPSDISGELPLKATVDVLDATLWRCNRIVVPFFYQSGEEIKAGDRVRLHGRVAEIESIHDPASDPNDWYVETYGGGVMIAEPKEFGYLFIETPVTHYEDLEFVSRGS